MSSLPEDLESYGYKENAAKTFERLIQPKKKHIYSGTALDVDARHDEQCAKQDDLFKEISPFEHSSKS